MINGKFNRRFPIVMGYAFLTTGIIIALCFSLSLAGLFVQPISQIMSPLVIIMTVFFLLGFGFAFKVKFDEKYDRTKFIKMIRYSLKSLWLLNRKILVILFCVCGVFYILSTELLDSIIKEDYPIAVVISFFSGMFFLSCIQILYKIGATFFDRVDWIVNNKTILLKSNDD